MSNLRQETHTQTRDCVLRAHASEMLARTNLAVEDFAESLYKACVSDFSGDVLALKKVPDLDGLFSANDQVGYSKAIGRWNKRVERWLAKDSVEIPSWLEEPWVTALLPEWRERCLIELSSRYGLLAVRPVSAHAGDAMQVFAGISTSFGHVAGVGGEVFADGLLDHLDASNAGELESHCRALAAHCVAMADKASEVSCATLKNRENNHA